MKTISRYFKVARKAVLESGEILKDYFATNFEVTYKGNRNPVTSADEKSEEAIITVLSRHFPDIKFVCEESCNSTKIKKNEPVWILDPLDGTVNFIHKFPVFSISLALYNGKDVLFGIVYNPITSEFFYSVKNKGAFLNDKRIKVSQKNGLKHSLIVTGFPYNYEKRQKSVIEKFRKFCLQAEGIRRLGSAALDLCYVACGRFDGFWEEGLHSWDVAAGALIVKEAGGKVTDFAGGNNYLFDKTLVASNSKIHSKMIEITGGKK
ncbi:MAG: inositol monophosphatase family protein [Elusimicrobiota bacterium]